MKLISVNLPPPAGEYIAGYPKQTGILKRPVNHAVTINTLGLEGDFIGDKKHHGGPDQAVYVYTLEDYTFWQGELGRALEPGTYGDNLTVQGFSSAEVNVGDRLKIGEVLLEVTDPRIPCRTLAARMEDLEFVKKFRAGARPGLYCRVLEPGTVQAGQEVEFIRNPEPIVAVLDLFELFFLKKPPRALLEKALSAPIGARTRLDLTAQLEKMGPS